MAGSSHDATVHRKSDLYCEVKIIYLVNIVVSAGAKRWEKRVPRALAEVLSLANADLQLASDVVDPSVDLALRTKDRLFVVGVKASASPAVVRGSAMSLASSVRKLRRAAIPLVVVPFMTPAGKRVCESAAVSWLDLSGNAHITGPGLRVIVEGNPNAFATRGRPSSAFAPKSARITRWLLMHPKGAFPQHELAEQTGVSQGLVSRVLSRLEEQQLVTREDGLVRVPQPPLLFEAWRDEYRFDKHTLIRGHVAMRTGSALTRFVADTLAEADVEHAATGLSAAWQMTHFATFRVATFYVASELDPDLEERMGFRGDSRGANLWLVVPNDPGVFAGAGVHDEVRCVHPVQAALDLEAHPERAAEAAERLRSELLMPTWA
ncbi:MAG: MarR family transcriptional regulator [Sandaracinus sp.]|nr:MarR family transcriptional regulator [Sandaracinus sp.]